MEAAAGGGSGGPAPFLIKTYEMVDDSGTDDIVSWSANKSSFVVWNPPEFSRVLLPTYFKHNNFSSFIRQLNTYGFRKSDPEKWEFSNDDFVKDRKHLLKNIHRRKPIHSHSNPPGTSVDPERVALDEEIDKLSREKEALQEKISRCQQELKAKQLLDEVIHRLKGIESKQDNLQNILEKAVHDPAFMEYLVRKIESMDFSAYNKKRRLPEPEHSQPVPDKNNNNNNDSSRPDCGNPFHQDFSSKLSLELPTVQDINLVSNSTQSSNEDVETLHWKISNVELRGSRIRTEGLFLAPETLDLSDTGASLGFKIDPSSSRKLPGSPRLLSLHSNLTCSDDYDSRMSSQLNLTLASLPLQLDNSHYSESHGIPQLGQNISKSLESRVSAKDKDSGIGVHRVKNNPGEGENLLRSSQEAEDKQEPPPAAPAKVNDGFWEQFLTERPGCSNNEEASSNYRTNTCDERNNGKLRNAKSAGQLTL